MFLQADPGLLQIQLPHWLLSLLPPNTEIPFTKIIGVIHGVLALLVSGWWQVTVPAVQRAQQQSAKSK